MAQSSANVVRWVIEKNSSLCVNGKSNVNSFTCNINKYVARDTISCETGSASPIKLSGKIQMEIVSFDCHSRMITRDLRKTLKANEYPKMTITFLTLEWMPGLHSEKELIKGWVEVEVAGVIKRFELSYSFSNDGPGHIQLDGGRTFNFSDFKLSPPKKMAGLIKIKDAFDVNFQLILRTV
ncbi:MAG: hypothetical protein ABIN97_11460 [Ginsengibacter sp.]